MSERLPDNLATLYDKFSKEAIDNILPGDTYHVDGVEFVCKYAPESTADRFFIVKPLPFVEYFVEFARGFTGGSIFELGIAEGGSTALLALVAAPRKLVAVDLEPEPLAALAEFAERRGLGDVVKPYYGVDQGDPEQLRALVRAEFDGPLDLVLDDASHDLDLTRSSFETLFPHLRPGGIYTIEDWCSDNRFYEAVVQAFRDPTSPGHAEAVAQLRASMAAPARQAPFPRPLSQLAVELLLACAASVDVVAEVTVNEHWVMVRRGPGEITGDFRLRDQFRDFFHFLPDDAS